MPAVRNWAGILIFLQALAPGVALALDAKQLAVVINANDPLSVQIGEYYVARRRILFSNVIRVQFPPGREALTAAEFQAIRAAVDEQVRPAVQAYALAWAAPYRVECMSITSAFAFGFDPALCAGKCEPTRKNPYFNSRASLPYRQLGMRPAMALAAASLEHGQALIDRGVAADGSFPTGTAYLLTTPDAARNVRRASYAIAEKVLRPRVYVRRVSQGESLRLAQDVLFYFIGAPHVKGLETLRFLPGAVADHLTSAGGQLTDSPQMSALRWLEAGATGSYGTVVEPCNIAGKFPNPAVLARHYLAGDTLIEAYWKSVAMPGQGIFIGEPLAAPFRRAAPGR
jgi:uncharacterized protein (TIGR03790 family)